MEGENSGDNWKETGFIETWASGFLMGVVACLLVTTLSKKRDAPWTSKKTRQPAIDA
jgi:hypothetical protein